DEEGELDPRLLVFREVDRRRGGRGRRLIEHVADDADHLDAIGRRPRALGGQDVLADRVLAGPQAPGHRLADDRDERMALHVGPLERAAAEQLDAERAEDARRDAAPVGGEVFVVRPFMSLGEELRGRVAAGKWRDARTAGADDAGDRSQRGFDLVEERASTLARHLVRRGDGQLEEALDAEAGRDALKLDEAARQKT